MPKKEPNGSQVEISRLTAHSMDVKLDNGVSVSISFNNNQIYLHFSGVESNEDGNILGIREAAQMGVELKLANYVAVEYIPRKQD